MILYMLTDTHYLLLKHVSIYLASFPEDQTLLESLEFNLICAVKICGNPNVNVLSLTMKRVRVDKLLAQ